MMEPAKEERREDDNEPAGRGFVRTQIDEVKADIQRLDEKFDASYSRQDVKIDDFYSRLDAKIDLLAVEMVKTQVTLGDHSKRIASLESARQPGP